ncbi:winged helix-turn-helix transcriptional regulator [Amycolatopsis sp. NPDC059657]|uniref:winged helix-turn-helix transcriptional regulator n=1 Tax=Amycolatopsis sp. NPDC059657 TaxID=3346899 RepID=UPI00366AB38B
MNARSYGQFCGLARAIEMIGERWSMLVVRDLVLGPKRFTELQAGLPKIPASILSTRLNELEHWGVIRRRVTPQLDASVVYELTEYGGELDQIVLQLGMWGARSLTEPCPEEVITTDAAILALYGAFRPESALDKRITFELRLGTLTLTAVVADGSVKVAEGCGAETPDISIEPKSPAVLNQLFKGEVNASAAIADGRVIVKGAPEHLETFSEIFHVDATPAPSEGLVVH